MAPPKKLLVVSYLAVLLVFVDASSSSSGGGRTFHADLRGQDLTDLYNSRVKTAEKMKRPMGSSSSAFGIFSHSGVRLTLEDGSQWLVHKGNGYGDTSETVVTRASGMSSDWKVTQTKDIHGSQRVADYVQAGRSNYNLIWDNCHDASDRMMKLGG